MKDINQQSSQALRKLLDEDAETLETSTREKLQSIRRQALASRGIANSRHQPSWFSAVQAKLVPMAMITCALLLVIGLWQPTQIPESPTTITELEIGPVLSPTEIELVEDLEFYEWLEANGYAG